MRTSGDGEMGKEAAPYYQTQRLDLTMGPRSPATIRQPGPLRKSRVR
jgi:hypothetical protein